MFYPLLIPLRVADRYAKFIGAAMTDEHFEIEDRPFPILPLRDVVVYPHMVVPLFVGREKSILGINRTQFCPFFRSSCFQICIQSMSPLVLLS